MPADRPARDATLTEAERRAVALLGEGHTAKSIAGELGISVHAVNERLREARRKTGLASSREVARWLRAQGPQENRDEQIGVDAPPDPVEPVPARRTAPRRRGWTKEILAMTGLAALFSLAALALYPGGGVAPGTADGTGTVDVRRLHDRLEAETVDRAWAARAQQRLDSIYGAIPGVGFVTVRCAATLREVNGTVAPADAARTIDSLRAAALSEAVVASGFERQVGSGFREDDAGATDGGAVTWFTAYWQRRSAAAEAPRVIATSPASGAAVPAGKLVLSVTFDQPVRPDGLSFTMPEGQARFPACDGLPERSDDGRTIAMRCLVQGGRAYAVGLEVAGLARAGAPATAPRSSLLRFRAQ
jgi:DNA-binding CsgD family transcriptional regulator